MSTFLLILLVALATCMGDLEQYEINSKSKNESLYDYDYGGQSNMIDNIIDEILQNHKSKLVEPIPLPDTILINIDTYILWIHVVGGLAIYDGGLWGAKSIQRHGHADFKYQDLHHSDVNCSFYFERLDFNYNFETNFLNLITTNGAVSGNMQQLIANTRMNIDIMNKTLQVTSVTLESAESINMEVTYCPLLDWLINLVFQLFLPFFKSSILQEIQNQAILFLRGHEFH